MDFAMSSRRSEIDFQPLPRDVQRRIAEAFPINRSMVKTEKEGFIISSNYKNYAKDVYNFPLNSTDVWVVTFPKSGTTWTQEQVWLLANNLDFESAKVNLNNRFPFLEMAGLLPEEAVTMIQNDTNNTCETVRVKEIAKKWENPHKILPEQDNSSLFKPIATPKEIAAMPSPRFVKTHLPFYLLPPKLLRTCKVVYVARNPKDVCVSWYYHHKLIKFQETKASFEEFMNLFINDEVMFSPYWPQVKAAWSLRHHPNFLFLFYEDMKSDLIPQLKKISAFLGKQYNDEDYKILKHHLIIDSFKKNPAVNNSELQKFGFFQTDGSFIREGKTGGWRNHFTPEMNVRFDEWIEDNSKDTSLVFKYDLESQD
ncbi:sulfotransferase 1C4-like isoform X2 [Artemia franciscana]|uniref:sulfotransferase 1C4-like isoform X2 n=1 Tax=Artemia franciscana TaxID=6661 RepID=UPI0032DAB43F